MWLLGAASASASTCEAWADAETAAEVPLPIESSGIAASRTRPGVSYLHGDNGDEPVLHAVTAGGARAGDVLVVDAENEDWEDLATAPCPDDGDCVYIGDIGDNDESRANVTVYVIREPEDGDDEAKTIRRYVGVYPDGPHDAEALMVDPCTGRIHVVTKEDPVRIFAFPFDPDDTVTLDAVAEVTLPGPVKDSRQATGADWDPDGDRFVIRGSDRLFVFTVDPDDRDAAFDGAPVEITGTNEVQGEGVCFGSGGELLTTGEGSPTPIHRVACDEPGPALGTCEFPQTGRKCGCDTAGPPGISAAAAAVAGLLLARRRRRA